MPSVADLQAHLRRLAGDGHTAVSLPPFTLFVLPDASGSAQAIPDEPIAGAPRAALAALREACALRERRLTIVFLEEFAPALTPALWAAGFVEAGRSLLMICTPATHRPVPPMPGLTLATLDANSPLAAIRDGLDANEFGFNPATTTRATDDDAEQFRRGLVEARAFTAYLDGQPVGAGMFNPPRAGLAELVGIATLAPYRRRGIATALTAHAAAVAFARGVQVAFLFTADAGARRVYERVGFRPAATKLVYRDPPPG